jgi:hypothetical protein
VDVVEEVSSVANACGVVACDEDRTTVVVGSVVNSPAPEVNGVELTQAIEVPATMATTNAMFAHRPDHRRM